MLAHSVRHDRLAAELLPRRRCACLFRRLGGLQAFVPTHGDKTLAVTPSEAAEHSHNSGGTITSGGISTERSGAMLRGTSRVSTAPPGTSTLAVTPVPSSS
jgi:hypothetical protein